MKAQHLLPALAMVLITATPALAHGNGRGNGHGHGHWQAAPVHASHGHVRNHPGRGHGRHAPVRYVPVVQPVVVTRHVPVYVPSRPVVYQQAPVRPPRQVQRPGASVVFRVNL
jgi:hypothetical protein